MHSVDPTGALRAPAPLAARISRRSLAASLSAVVLVVLPLDALARSQPVAVSGQATNITANGAVVSGSVDANNSTATAWFDYGLTNVPYASTIGATPGTVKGTNAVTTTAQIAGLACGTTYHWRAHAKSAAGENKGADRTFTTAACAGSPPATAIPPTATTSGVTGVSSNGATLGGSVVAGSGAATATFDWGTTTAYGSSLAATPATLAASTDAVAVSASLAGLACGSVYHYRASAASSAGQSSGIDQVFNTPACTTGTGAGSLRVTVSGFGQVASDVGGLSCGSVPANGTGSSSHCFASSLSGNVTLTATPFSPSFVFAGWSGDAACVGNACTIPMNGTKWARARFAPVAGSNACTAMGLVADKATHPLNANYPKLVAGQSFVDPNFGTTIRKITDAPLDNLGGTSAVPAYSTISAFNADESYLVLYRVGYGHVLHDGKTYAFIRALDDLPTADVEQFYWDTTKPNILYGASGTKLYRYDVNAPAGQRTSVLHDFSSQCGSKTLYGGSDPLFNSWDSRLFGLTCQTNGAMFGYDAVTDTLGAISTTLARADGYTAPQATASGRKLVMVQSPYVRVFDLNLVGGPQLDQGTGAEHAGMSMDSGGADTYIALNYDVGPSGTAEGTVVQYNLDGTPDGANRIRGRVIVGPSTGYPYPPGGTHIGSTAFHRTGLVGVSIEGAGTGSALLDNELLLVDTDAATNPAGAVCRIGHNRSNALNNYWAEPHAAISPSGTRIVFGSSWGNSSSSAPVNSYVVELPGYRP